MKCLWSLCLFILWSTPFFAHEIHLAVFDFYEKKGESQLLAVFDKYDLAESLQVFYQHDVDANDEELLLDCVKDYLDAHLKLKADNEDIQLLPTDLQLKEEVVNIEFNLSFFPKKKREINIQNSLLLELFPQQTHLIRFQGKIFKMNTRRRTITFPINPA